MKVYRNEMHGQLLSDEDRDLKKKAEGGTILPSAFFIWGG